MDTHTYSYIHDSGVFTASVALSINQSACEIFILLLSVFIASIASIASIAPIALRCQHLFCLRLSCKFDFDFDCACDCMPHAAALHIQVLIADALYSVDILLWDYSFSFYPSS